MKPAVETKRLQSNLLAQNVYVRDVVLPFDEKNDYSISKFISLDYADEPGARKEVYTEQDYPITPDSVNSYADSCNYKLDPLGAQARSSLGSNLGDVTFMQKLMDMDSSERLEFLESFRSKLNSSSAVAGTPAAAPAAGVPATAPAAASAAAAAAPATAPAIK